VCLNFPPFFEKKKKFIRETPPLFGGKPPNVKCPASQNPVKKPVSPREKTSLKKKRGVPKKPVCAPKKTVCPAPGSKTTPPVFFVSRKINLCNPTVSVCAPQKPRSVKKNPQSFFFVYPQRLVFTTPVCPRPQNPLTRLNNPP